MSPSLPLLKITSYDATAPAIETTPAGWFIRTAHGIRARVRGFADGLACRVAPGHDAEVVQLAIGPATSMLCNAIYSPASDQALVFEADDLAFEPLAQGGFSIRTAGPVALTLLDDYMRKHRGLAWFQPLDRSAFPRPPSGWCSWYEYYLAITEDEIVKNVDWLEQNLRRFGLDWVQVDDGWQGVGRGYGSNRDWFVTCAADFPRGMGWIAEYIRSHGFRPGLWLIPNTQSDRAMFEAHPDLFVRRADGSSVGETAQPVPEPLDPDHDGKWTLWNGRYLLDPTSPKAPAYFERLFRMLCEEWGYEYLKFDAQESNRQLYGQWRSRLADSSLDSERVMRLVSEPARRALGPRGFLLNCGAQYTSCGVCQGIRTGGDVDLRTGWSGMQPAITATMRWLYLNTIAFYTDPDGLCVREPLAMDQARLWTTLLGITGQLLMASDKMYTLAPDRVGLLRRVFPVADIRPMELYPLDDAKRPAIFDLKVRRPGLPEWDVAALFNWSDREPRQFEIAPTRLGLEGSEWLCTDGWTGELLHSGDGRIELEVAPAACRVVVWWPRLGRPQFLGSSRHLTQGSDDLERMEWVTDRSELRGRSHVVGGDPYRLRFHVPEGWATEPQPGLATRGPLAELTIEREANASVEWAVGFRRA
jgi:hypothetical protein